MVGFIFSSYRFERMHFHIAILVFVYEWGFLARDQHTPHSSTLEQLRLILNYGAQAILLFPCSEWLREQETCTTAFGDSVSLLFSDGWASTLSPPFSVRNVSSVWKCHVHLHCFSAPFHLLAGALEGRFPFLTLPLILFLSVVTHLVS